MNYAEANEKARIEQANKLRCKVKARNLVNKLVNLYAPQFIEAARPFVGKKIDTQSGLAKAFKAALPNIEAELKALDGKDSEGFYIQIQSYRASSLIYDLGWAFRVMANIGGVCSYQEEIFYIGSFNHVNFRAGTDLEKLAEFHERRTDFNVEEIKQWRADYNKARDEASAALSKLAHFGEHDNH